jgi:hypothetical protein
VQDPSPTDRVGDDVTVPGYLPIPVFVLNGDHRRIAPWHNKQDGLSDGGFFERLPVCMIRRAAGLFRCRRE